MRMTMLLWAQAVILALCSLAMTSCDVDNSDEQSEEYATKIANTRWQLSEVVNDSRTWVTTDKFADLHIPDLWFGADKRYEIRIEDSYGYRGVNTIRGNYSIDHGTITFVEDRYPGVILEFRIDQAETDILRGIFVVFDQEQRSIDIQTGAEIITQPSRRFEVKFRRKG